MKKNVTIIDKDKGWKKIQKILRSSNQPHVKVGIMGADATAAHAHTELTNVEVGSFHEFGIGVPQRSFIRDTFDYNRDRYYRALKAMAQRVVAGKYSLKVGMEAVGQLAESDFIGRIETNNPPFTPLADSTIRRKGSSKPLIDTGQLKNSITHATEGV